MTTRAFSCSGARRYARFHRQCTYVCAVRHRNPRLRAWDRDRPLHAPCLPRPEHNPRVGRRDGLLHAMTFRDKAVSVLSEAHHQSARRAATRRARATTARLPRQLLVWGRHVVHRRSLHRRAVHRPRGCQLGSQTAEARGAVRGAAVAPLAHPHQQDTTAARSGSGSQQSAAATTNLNPKPTLTTRIVDSGINTLPPRRRL